MAVPASKPDILDCGRGTRRHVVSFDSVVVWAREIAAGELVDHSSGVGRRGGKLDITRG